MALMLRRGYDPFPEISRLRDRMDRVFDESLRNFFERGESDEPAATWYPTVDVFEGEEEIRLRAELPGMREDDVEITLENGTLTLRGEKRFQEEEEGENGHYRRVESRYGRFVRQFPLPSSVDAEKIAARFKDGVLHIHLPKSEVAKPKRIAIKS